MSVKIDRIELRKTLPRVFEHEAIPVSDVWKCDVAFERGKHYIIEAASGTGKSSLCAYIYGNRRDYCGRIVMDGRDVSQFSVAEWQRIRREVLAYLPQELDLFPELTALQNIELKNRLTSHVAPAQVEEWLHQLGIDSRKYYPVGRMSIGQQQRVAIIRCLCQPFSFLLLDEPVSHLDEQNNQIAANIIMEQARLQGASIIATSVGNNIKISTDRTFRL